jgi:hypothetical protein
MPRIDEDLIGSFEPDADNVLDFLNELKIKNQAFFPISIVKINNQDIPIKAETGISSILQVFISYIVAQCCFSMNKKISTLMTVVRMYDVACAKTKIERAVLFLKVSQRLKEIESEYLSAMQPTKKRKLNDAAVSDIDEQEENTTERTKRRTKRTSMPILLAEKYKQWSEDECLFLIYGVLEFGVDAWDEILKSKYSSRFKPKRAGARSLKIKYQCMVRHNQIAKYKDLITRFPVIIESAIQDDSHQDIMLQTLLAKATQ